MLSDMNIGGSIQIPVVAVFSPMNFQGGRDSDYMGFIAFSRVPVAQKHAVFVSVSIMLPEAVCLEKRGAK